jgi:4-amino-4-deoxy-L-arabinose transferase-like glycosyltransferase
MARSKPSVNTFQSPAEIIYLCLVIMIGFGLRVTNLNNLPLSLSLDEAVNGIDALRLFRAGWLTPFLQNNFGRETLFFYLQSLALQLYGISIFSLRFVSALVGTLTIPLMYAVGKRLGLNNLVLPTGQAQGSGPTLNVVSLLAATGLAISYWHIFFSRVALRAILLPALLLGLVWCFWEGWYARSARTSPTVGGMGTPSYRRWWLVGAGFLLGLTLYTYLAARLLPLLFVAFVAVELIGARSDLKRKIADFLIFGLAGAFTIIPLAFYFYQNPQAFIGRTGTISILAEDDPLQTLTGNLIGLLRIHLLGGTWLGGWPALNVLLALGLLIGLPVCLYQIKKATPRFLLLWWAIGILPMLLSRQDWEATTTILRSIVAWPPLFFASAIGLATLANTSFTLTTNARKARLKGQDGGMPPKWIMATLCLVLIVGGLTSLCNYFRVWATTYNRERTDDAAHLARYLNSQPKRPSLIPLSVYKDSVTYFLLQARYPNLSNIDSASLHTLLTSEQSESPAQATAAYLLPDEPTFESAFVLLVPSANGTGTAYLLPPLTVPKIEALYSQTNVTTPLTAIFNGQQEPVAHVYPLAADAPFLPDEPISWRPIEANFNDAVWLTGYRVEPAVAKPGDMVTLYLEWQMQGLIDGDYYLFLHLFDIPQEGRRGQSNLPLNSIIHRWSAPLTFVDTHDFWLAPDSPEGVYLFEMGLYHNFSLERLPVIIGETDQSPDDKITLGKFHVQLHPPEPPEYPIYAQFGDKIALIGGDFPEGILHPGQTLTYTLHWQALDSVNRDYTVFNHVLDSEGNIRTQQDSMPQQGRYATTMWDPGEIVMDTHAILLPSDLESGEYTLRIGLYESETGQRLRLVNETQDFVELPDLIVLGSVRE